MKHLSCHLTQLRKFDDNKLMSKKIFKCISSQIKSLFGLKGRLSDGVRHKDSKSIGERAE